MPRQLLQKQHRGTKEPDGCRNMSRVGFQNEAEGAR